MKHRPPSKSTSVKVARAAAKGWTRREFVGPCLFLKLSAVERRARRKGAK
jgi:hypothetical protein